MEEAVRQGMGNPEPQGQGGKLKGDPCLPCSTGSASSPFSHGAHALSHGWACCRGSHYGYPCISVATGIPERQRFSLTHPSSAPRGGPGSPSPKGASAGRSGSDPRLASLHPTRNSHLSARIKKPCFLRRHKAKQTRGPLNTCKAPLRQA